jgi:hypothetical protein
MPTKRVGHVAPPTENQVGLVHVTLVMDGVETVRTGAKTAWASFLGRSISKRALSPPPQSPPNAEPRNADQACECGSGG